jgi:hypothetical protein
MYSVNNWTGVFEFVVSHPKKRNAKSPPKEKAKGRKGRRSRRRYGLLFEKKSSGGRVIILSILKSVFMLNN